MTKTYEQPGISEVRFQALFNHVPLGLLLAGADNRYIAANPCACQILGYLHEDLLGLRTADIVVASDPGKALPAPGEVSNLSVRRAEWKLRRKDSTVFSADVTTMMLPDGSQISIIDDNSDRLRVYEDRAHFSAIVASSLDAIVGNDLNGIVTSWNAAATTIFGYTAANMIGTPVARLIPDDRKDEEGIILGKLRRGEQVRHLETVRRTKDNRLIDVSVSISPIRNQNGEIVGASKIARDISLLKHREAEILRLSRLYSALSQVNQAIVWSPTQEALFSKVCEVLVAFGGFSMAWIGLADEPSGRIRPVGRFGDTTNYLDSIEVHSGERPEAFGPSGLAFRSDRSYICNDMKTDPATSPWRPQIERAGFQASAAFPIRLNSVVCGILTVYAMQKDFFHDKEISLLEEAATDISFALNNFAKDDARRRIEKNLEAEKNFSDTMIQSMPGLFYFYDFSGRFLRGNRNFETVSGYSGAEIARMHPRDFFSGPDKDLLDLKMSEVLERGASTLEVDFVSKDGIATPYFFTGNRVIYNGVPGLVGVGVDITVRKLAEVDREMRHRAEAADRIKSAFLATMSHELRTPLNSIIGFTGVMLQGLAGSINAEQEKQLGMVQGSARHLLALVNDVLDVSKIEAGQLEVVQEVFDIGQSITKIANLMRPAALAKGLKFQVRLQPGLGGAVSDPRRFEQILLNLIGNAIKFTDVGEVTVSAERIEAYNSLKCPGGETAFCIRVTDTGVGIKAEDLPALYQPFRQIETGLSPQREGTGLGLAICHRLALLMGGEIQAISEFGRGSTFTAILPVRGKG